jgi:predicted DNA-binding WGR domain protein
MRCATAKARRCIMRLAEIGWLMETGLCSGAPNGQSSRLLVRCKYARSTLATAFIVVCLNRCGITDSNFALDVSWRLGRHFVMFNDQTLAPQRIQLLVLERVDKTQNMARYYVLSIEPTLFGDAALVREWGRLGSIGWRRIDLYSIGSDAQIALDAWLARKTLRGYTRRSLAP